MTTVAMHQPNFFPWIGYFEKIANCDYFVFLDDVQYSKGTLANRTYINDKNTNKLIRLTCPVHYDHPAKIREVGVLKNKNWENKIVKTLRYNYSGKEWSAMALSVLIRRMAFNLADYNIENIIAICRYLGVAPRKGFIIQSELGEFTRKKTELLVDIIGYLGCDTYYSGTGILGRPYLDIPYMEECGIKVKIQDNTTFPIYSIIELLMTMDGYDIKKRWL